MSNVRPLVLAAALLSSTALAAPSPLLPLLRGTYLREGTDPADPPFAAILKYDGHAFSGPHESGCTSRVLSHRGATWRLATTCSVLGDGKPSAPCREIERIVIESPTTIRFAHGRDVATYHLSPMDDL